MAVLTGFGGSHAVLAAHAKVLPQPDQLCGPFAAYVALHAVCDSPPSMVALAAASGTTIWPHDVPGWRPAGAPLDRTGWDRLPAAPTCEVSGTNAAGLAAGLAAVAGVAVAPVPAPEKSALGRLLAGLLAAAYPVGVVANLRTGVLAPTSVTDWDVGHFVVLHGYQPEAGLVGVADTYAELGAPGEPPGCRSVTLDALAAALGAAPGRGLLLLVRPDDEAAMLGLVAAAGLRVGLWST